MIVWNITNVYLFGAFVSGIFALLAYFFIIKKK